MPLILLILHFLVTVYIIDLFIPAPEPVYYMEAQPSFSSLQNFDLATNKWIRDPKNLATLHETLKKIGYSNLIDTCNDGNICSALLYADINRPLVRTLDSLEITYKLDSVPDKYYREFWNRRRKEKNDSIVFVIVKEVNGFLKNGQALPYNEKLVNDTLYQLISIRRNPDPGRIDFFRLRGLGFHESASNLAWVMYGNTDTLVASLTRSKKETKALLDFDYVGP